MSTNRTVVHLVAAQPVGGAELANLRLDLMLEGLESGELVHPSGQALQVLDDQRANGSVALRGGDPSVAIDVIRDGDCNIPHRNTVTQLHWIGGSEAALIYGLLPPDRD